MFNPYGSAPSMPNDPLALPVVMAPPPPVPISEVKKPSKAPTPMTKPNEEPLPKIYLERLGTPEEQAQRAKLARDLMIQQQAAQRQLASAQARAGIRGGAATTQQARLARQIETGRAEQEAAQALARRMFNIEQSQKEQFGNTATAIALRQIASGLKGQEAIAQAAKEGNVAAVEALRQSRGGGLFGKIICTELHRQGVLDTVTYEIDQKFGEKMLLEDPELMCGYWVIAKPIVRLMRRKKWAVPLVAFFAKPWARHMSYLMGAREKDSLMGRIVMAIGKPLCRIAFKLKKRGMQHA